MIGSSRKMNANAGIVYSTPEIDVIGETAHRCREA